MESVRQIVHPRDEIMLAMERIYRYRMTTTSGGNLSIRERDGSIWITPARIDKGSLTRNDIVRVDRNRTVEGAHRPSSEFPFHQAIYKVRPDINAIVHAHPVALVAFSISRSVPDTKIFHQAYFMGGKVGFAPYALPGSEALGESIAKQFADGCDSVILENHGVVVGGNDLSHAFQRFEAFEFAAKTLIKAQRLGSVRYLAKDALELANQRKVGLASTNPPEVSNREQEARKQLIDFVRRGCRQRLLISTEGSFSARIDEHSFLITPSQKDRENLRVDDLVLVHRDQFESGKVPSRAVELHASIYAKDASVNSIVFAHPVNATAFSITDSIFDARTIPESYIFLKDVPRIPYGTQYAERSVPSDPASHPISNYVSMKTPASIVSNDGVVVGGSSILDAFDRLEVFESTAEAIINALSLGAITPMNDAVIDELRIAFKMD